MLVNNFYYIWAGFFSGMLLLAIAMSIFFPQHNQTYKSITKTLRWVMILILLGSTMAYAVAVDVTDEFFVRSMIIRLPLLIAVILMFRLIRTLSNLSRKEDNE